MSALKLAAGMAAAVLLLTYTLPMVLKLRDPALAVVIGIGFAAMVVDLWQLLRGTED